MRNKIVLTFGLNLFLGATWGMDCDVDLKLAEFKKDPAKFLDRAVPKKDADCGDEIFKYFSLEKIGNKDFVKIKDEYRKKVCHTDPLTFQTICLDSIAPGEDVEEGRAAISSVDLAENLVTNFRNMESNLLNMDKQGLHKGRTSLKPWSDWYWPIAVGQLSYRYQDDTMIDQLYVEGVEDDQYWPWLFQWHEDHEPLLTNVNLLSPAEKYDILIGDDSFSLTNASLEAGRYYYENYGKVESWMGICHGWAPASYMLPRPVKTIDVLAADGKTKIQFKPSDLKALASQLWAAGSSRTKFIGGRCNSKDPKKDKNGRVLDDKCFDNNPGTWHKTVVNQVGIMKSTFVMDATYDYEVWNHPVTSYNYKYFNPISMVETQSLEEAVASLKDMTDDKFGAYRGAEAKLVVGVNMEVKYLVETEASSSYTDDPMEDAFNYAYYTYDLELDENYNIVGGEWYTNKHPDFLWTPFENSKAVSDADRFLPAKLDIEELGKYKLSRFTKYSSAKGQPIGQVVEGLLEKASAK